MIRVFISILMYLIGWICEGHSQEMKVPHDVNKSIALSHESLSDNKQVKTYDNFILSADYIFIGKEENEMDRTAIKEEQVENKYQ